MEGNGEKKLFQCVNVNVILDSKYSDVTTRSALCMTFTLLQNELRVYDDIVNRIKEKSVRHVREVKWCLSEWEIPGLIFSVGDELNKITGKSTEQRFTRLLSILIRSHRLSQGRTVIPQEPFWSGGWIIIAISRTCIWFSVKVECYLEAFRTFFEEVTRPTDHPSRPQVKVEQLMNGLFFDILGRYHDKCAYDNAGRLSAIVAEKIK